MERNGNAGEEIAEVILWTGGKFTGRAGDPGLENPVLIELQPTMEMAGKDPAKLVAALGGKRDAKRCPIFQKKMFVDPGGTDRAERVMKEYRDGAGTGDLAKDRLNLIVRELPMRPVLRRDFPIHDKEFHVVAFPASDAVAETPVRSGDERLMRPKSEGFPHHRNIIMISRRKIDRDGQFGKDLSGECVGIRIRVIYHIPGVDDEIWLKGQGIDRRD